MSTCPDGHSSQSADYCDVCGAPIAPGSAGHGSTPPANLPGPSALSLPVAPTAAAGPVGTVTGTRDCPNCGDVNPADGLFCESCGYDFVTGQLPPPMLQPPTGVAPVSVVPPSPSPSPSGPPSMPAGVEWVVEQWIDPEWYAAKGGVGADPCPTPGVPRTIGLVGPTALVGRRSASKGINPEIDCSSDSGVSRRHAQLTLTDGRWYVEDLGSTNGTHVGKAAAAMPTDPIPAGARHELADDERIYVGAWTRLVLRSATDSERGT